MRTRSPVPGIQASRSGFVSRTMSRLRGRPSLPEGRSQTPTAYRPRDDCNEDVLAFTVQGEAPPNRRTTMGASGSSAAEKERQKRTQSPFRRFFHRTSSAGGMGGNSQSGSFAQGRNVAPAPAPAREVGSFVATARPATGSGLGTGSRGSFVNDFYDPPAAATAPCEASSPLSFTGTYPHAATSTSTSFAQSQGGGPGLSSVESRAAAPSSRATTSAHSQSQYASSQYTSRSPTDQYNPRMGQNYGSYGNMSGLSGLSGSGGSGSTPSIDVSGGARRRSNSKLSKSNSLRKTKSQQQQPGPQYASPPPGYMASKQASQSSQPPPKEDVLALRQLKSDMANSPHYAPWRRVMSVLSSKHNKTTIPNSGGGSCFFKSVSQFIHEGREWKWKAVKEDVLSRMIALVYGPGYSYRNPPEIDAPILGSWPHTAAGQEYAMAVGATIASDPMQLWNYIFNSADLETDHGLMSQLVAEVIGGTVSLWYSSDDGQVLTMEGVRGGGSSSANSVEILYHCQHYELVLPLGPSVSAYRKRAEESIVKRPPPVCTIPPAKGLLKVPISDISMPVPEETGSILTKLAITSKGLVMTCELGPPAALCPFALCCAIRLRAGLWQIHAGGDASTMPCVAVVRKVSTFGYDIVGTREALFGSVSWVRWGKPYPRVFGSVVAPPSMGSVRSTFVSTSPDFRFATQSFILRHGSDRLSNEDPRNVQLQCGNSAAITFGYLKPYSTYVLDFCAPCSPITALGMVLPWFELVEPQFSGTSAEAVPAGIPSEPSLNQILTRSVERSSEYAPPRSRMSHPVEQYYA